MKEIKSLTFRYMDLDLCLPRQSKRQTCSKRMSLVTFNEVYKVLHSANPEMS